MQGYFDDDEPELDEPRRDKELTLGWGALSALFLGLVLICGLCFGLGYAVGHGRSAPGPAAAAQPPAAPDAEPLQPNSSIPKPDAAAQAPAPAVVQSNASIPTPSDSGAGSNPAPAQPNPAAGGQGSAPANAGPPPVRSALGGSGADPSQASSTPAVHPALPSMSQYMVEIAAVKNGEDANVLTNALRKRDYPVTERREPADGLIHVRIGPFPSHEEANRWRMRLQDDGYNAMIQP
jgi:hypothetical protein